MVMDLLKTLSSRNVRLDADGDRLVVNAPKGAITSELAAQIKANKSEILQMLAELKQDGAKNPIEPLGDEATGIPSINAERMLMFDQLHAEAAEYNLPGAWELVGDLDMAALQAAVEDFIDRHSMLRSLYIKQGASLKVVTAEHRPIEVEVEDLRHMQGEEQTRKMRTYLEDKAKIPFDVSKDYPFRVYIVHMTDERHIFYIVSHSITWDAWSFDIMLEDMGELYAARQQGRKAELDPLPLRYDDYALWQRRYLTSDGARANLDYWRKHLEGGLARLPLPVDFATFKATHKGARYNLQVPEQLKQQVFSFAKEASVTPYMVFLATYAALLSRYAHSQYTLITTPVRGRERPELEHILGSFTNNIFLHIKVDQSQTFRELTQSASTTALEGFSRQDIPVDTLLDALDGKLSNMGLFQTTFSYQNAEGRAKTWGDLKVLPGPTRDFHAVHADLSFWIREGANVMGGAVDYRVDLYDEPTIAQFVEHLYGLLAIALANPDAPLSSLDLRSTDEIQATTGLAAEGAPLNQRDDDLREQVSAIDRLDKALLTAGDHSLTGALLSHPAQENGSRPDELWVLDVLDPVLAAVRDSTTRNVAVDIGSHTFTAAAVVAAAQTWMQVLDLNPDSRTLCALPDRHEAVPSLCLAHVLCQGTLSMPGPAVSDDEVSLYQTLARIGPTHLITTPGMLAALAELDEGGAMADMQIGCFDLPAPLKRVLDERLGRLHGIYGAPGTQGLGLIARGDGVPVSGAKVRVRDPQLGSAPVNVRGRLEISGPWQSGAGWVATRLSVRWMPDGRLRISEPEDQPATPNAEDLALLGHRLTQIEAVEDAYVGVRHPSAFGPPRTVAWVVQRPGMELTQTELRDAVAELAPDLTLPELFVSVEHLPRTNGVINPRALRDPYEALSAARYEPPTGATETLLAEIWREVLNVDRISAHDNFSELGGTSLQALRVLQETQTRMGWQFEPRLLFFQSLRQLSERAPHEGAPERAPHEGAPERAPHEGAPERAPQTGATPANDLSKVDT